MSLVGVHFEANWLDGRVLSEPLHVRTPGGGRLAPIEFGNHLGEGTVLLTEEDFLPEWSAVDVQQSQVVCAHQKLIVRLAAHLFEEGKALVLECQ